MIKISNWMINNKLTLNYKKKVVLCFTLVNKKTFNESNFSALINQKSIEKSKYVKYPGLYLENNLFWKIYLDKLCKKVSKVCGIIYK